MNVLRASYFVTLSMITVCGLIWWAPSVSAQTLSFDSVTAPKTAESGWFDQNSKSATSPHVPPDMADNRSNADFSRVVNDHDTAASISRNAPPILPLDHSLQLRYMQWESRLADTVSPISQR